MRKSSTLVLATCLGAWIAAALAASPPQGTATAANDAAHPLTYTAGPFTTPNSFGNSVAGECDPQQSPTNPVPCDVFYLTTNLPADYALTHPGDTLHVRIEWSTPAADFDLYLYDNDKNDWTAFPTTTPIASSVQQATAFEEVQVPALGGAHHYVVQVSTTSPAGQGFTGKVWIAPGSAQRTSGTVTQLNTAASPMQYTAGPFTEPNAFGNSIPGECSPGSAEVPCHVFYLTSDLPADYTATHPADDLFVRIEWGTAAADFDLYLWDNDNDQWTDFPTGTPIAKSVQSATTFEQVEIPARNGKHKYVIQVSPTSPAGQSFTGKAWFAHASAGGAPVLPAGNATGIPPRFNLYVPTDANGAPASNMGMIAGEPTVFSNPKTGSFFFEALFETLRAKFDDSTSPAKATWEFKDPPAGIGNKVTVDPLLVGDPVTGRVWAMQLAGGQSVTDYSDDDGETWTPTLSGGIASGADHQGMGVGPYPTSGAGALIQHPLYPSAAYYCSQDVATAFCARSDDGGMTYGPIVPMYNAATDKCVGLHGHPTVAPDGTVYVPNKGCGLDTPVIGQGKVSAIVSEDAGTSWTVRAVPDSTGGLTDKGDPSVAVDKGGKMYFAYTNLDNDHLYVTTSTDHGVNYTASIDVGALGGVTHSVFPTMVAGDAGRAAVAFFGTTFTGAGSATTMEFKGIWHVFVATTYDGGATWFVQNVTPEDPIQGVGGIGNGGDNRNHYDFFDAGIDKEGRVIVGYSDGCTASCAHLGGPNTFAKLTGVARQAGGRRMYAAFDPVEPGLPGRPRLTGYRKPRSVVLSWEAPDGAGADITGYELYRSVDGGAEALLAGNLTARGYTDVTTASHSYAYRLKALNPSGASPFSAVFSPKVGDFAPQPDLGCSIPGLLHPDRTGEGGTQGANDIAAIGISEPKDMAGKVVFTMTAAVPATNDSLAYIYFDPSGSGLRYRLQFSADGTSDVSTFKDGEIEGGCGTEGLDECQHWTSLGALEAGSGAQSDGSIRLVIDKAKLKIKTGDVLLGVAGREDQATSPSGVLAADYVGGFIDYTVVGNDWCALPVASLSATPVSGTTPLDVVFDASASATPYAGATLIAYTLDFGDGSAPVTQDTPAFSHTYPTAGTFNASLTVTDSRDKVSTNAAKQAITVTVPTGGGGGTLVAPTASLSASPASGVAPLSVAFDASASSTTNAGAHISAYTLDFGDGSAPQTQATPNFIHLYSAAGQYTASLTVTDSAAKSSTNLAQQLITVTPASTGGGGGGGSTGSSGSIGNNAVGGALGAPGLLVLLAAGLARRRRR